MEQKALNKSKEELMLQVADYYGTCTFDTSYYFGKGITDNVRHTFNEEIPLLVKPGELTVTTRGIYVEKNAKDDESPNHAIEWGQVKSISLIGGGWLSSTSIIINDEEFASFFGPNKKTESFFNSLLQDIHAIAQLQSVDALAAQQVVSLAKPRWLFRDKDGRLYNISSREELKRTLASAWTNKSVTKAWDYKDLDSNDQDWKSVGPELYRQFGLNYHIALFKRSIATTISLALLLAIVVSIPYAIYTVFADGNFGQFVDSFEGQSPGEIGMRVGTWAGSLIGVIALTRVHPILGMISAVILLNYFGFFELIGISWKN